MLMIMLLQQEVPCQEQEQRGGHCQEAEGHADSGTDSFCSEWLQKN